MKTYDADGEYDAKAMFYFRLVTDAVMAARREGVIVTVENHPEKPLTQGNHTPKVSVYRARETAKG